MHLDNVLHEEDIIEQRNNKIACRNTARGDCGLFLKESVNSYASGTKSDVMGELRLRLV